MNNMKNQKRNGHLVVWRLVILLFMSCFLTAFSSEARDNDNAEPPLYGFEVQDATDAFYVNDFAGIFTEEQKEAMISKAVQFDEESGGIQVVITTVESLKDTVVRWSEGFEPENLEIYDIAFQMYDQYGLGANDMGILILFSKGDIDVYLATGYQMQIYITDSDAMRIMYTYGKEEFDNDQFAEWLIALQDGVIQEIRKVVPSNMKGEVATENVANDVTEKDKGERRTNFMQAIIAVIEGISILIFLVLAFVYLNRSKKNRESAIEALKDDQANEIKKLIKKHIDDMQAETDKYQREVKCFQEESTKRLQELNNVKKELSEKNAFLTRVRVLYPDIEEEVHQMIEDEFKASASQLDELIKECTSVPADKDNISIFRRGIDAYNATTLDVRNYVTEDVSRLSSLYEESCALKEEYDRQEQEKRDRAIASQTCEEIRSIFLSNHIGNYENYESLSLAYRKYTSLTFAQKSFFPDMQMIHDLEDVLKEAKKDYDNFNIASEAERKARSIAIEIHHADEDDRDKLKKALKCYKELSPDQQAYFSNDLLREIKRLKDEADRDYEMQENRRRLERMRHEEEERRRYDHHIAGGSSHKAGISSSSAPMNHAARPSGTSISRSVHSGHGGRASGGGARMTKH